MKEKIMARPKQIEDDVLLDLIKKFFNDECRGNIKKLKASEIVKYINANGYPDYPATTLRRTPIAMKYIEELKATVVDEHYVTSVSYQTIDAALLVNTNRSRDTLIKAITDRDNYYKMIADSAAQTFERYNTLSRKYDTEVIARKKLEDTVSALKELNSENKKRIQELEKELKAYKSVVETYVYPEIANELLAKEGAIRQTDEIIKADSLENDIITATTDIKKISKSRSNVIEGLFKLED
jgi:hypothetical protein